MDTTTNQRRRQRQNLALYWMMVMQAVIIYNTIRRRNRQIPRGPRINWDSEREMTLTRMFGSSDRICHALPRMKIAPFQRFCARLRTYGLVDSRSVKVEEQVAIFLNTVGHDQRNRTESFTFLRSGQTVSYYFHRVLQACLGLYRDVVNNATIQNSPYDKEKLQPWFQYFQDSVGAIDGSHIPAFVPVEDQASHSTLMAHNCRSCTGPFPLPRPTTQSDGNDSGLGRMQAELVTRIRNVRWSEEMDDFMLTSLVEQVLAGHKRSDNGFTSFQVSKAMERVLNGCGVTVTDKNVRARLKTLKKEYGEVRQLLNMSGFGLDPETSRILADAVAWDEFVKGKPEFGKWKCKFCPRYDDMETFFGNDAATGERSVSGFDNFSPFNATDESVNEVDVENVEMDNSPVTARKRTVEEGTSKGKRRRGRPVDESTIALPRIAESSGKIAKAIEMQATLDTKNHVEWQLILEKLEAIDLDLKDIMVVMKALQADDGLAKVFVNLKNEKYMRALVFDKLGRDPPPLP